MRTSSRMVDDNDDVGVTKIFGAWWEFEMEEVKEGDKG